MGQVSLLEDIDRLRNDARLAAEKITTKAVPAHEIEKLVAGLLKRCKYIEQTMGELAKLPNDLSATTRNRVYQLKLELDEERETSKALLAKVSVLEKRIQDMMARRQKASASPKQQPKSKKKKKARKPYWRAGAR
jgi:hypothetical protein